MHDGKAVENLFFGSLCFFVAMNPTIAVSAKRALQRVGIMPPAGLSKRGTKCEAAPF